MPEAACPAIGCGTFAPPVLPVQNQYYYLQELTGFFVPPVDGNYTFYIRGDDGTAFLLSTDSSPARLRLVAQSTTYQPDATFGSFFFTSPSSGWGLGFAGQVSAPIPLRAGTPYFSRALHVQGGGGGYFDMAVRISTKAPNFGSEAQRTLRSTPTVLKVQTLSAVVREVQVRLGPRARL